MAESIDKNQELLLQAKKETAQAAKELDEVLAAKRRVDEITLETGKIYLGM